MTLKSRFPRVTDDSLPGIYRSADEVAIKAQSSYFLATKWCLVLLVFGAAASSISPSQLLLASMLRWLSAIALLLSVILSFVVRLQRKDKVWFAARSVAESAKTLAWRYMTGAEPFSTGLDKRQTDQLFEGRLKDMLAQGKDILGEAGGALGDTPNISSVMRSLRVEPVTVRCDTYLECRIVEQKKWYASKATASRELADKFFFWVVSFQVLAVVLAFARAATPELQINLAAPISALAAVLIAWSQLRRYQELAQAYSLASHELGVILSVAQHVTSEGDLSNFVGDAENAISREHTLWLARRDSR